MSRKRIIGLLLVSLFAITGIASSASLLENGGFETPANTQSWQIYPDGYAGLVWQAESNDPDYPAEDNLEIQTFSTLGLTPFEGSQYAELDPNRNVRISQIIAVQEGTTYHLSYAQSCRAGDPGLGTKASTLGVFWDGEKIAETTCTRDEAQVWALHAVAVTADADGDVRVTFADEGISDSYGVLLDDVRLEAGVIPSPEFPSVALPAGLLVGLVGAVFLVRGKRED